MHSYFPNLRYIEISHNIQPANRSLDWMSTFKGIAINNKSDDIPNTMRIIYLSMSKELESLHVSSTLISKRMNGKLDNLKEICIPWSHSTREIKILMKQKMNKLKRVHFRSVGTADFRLDVYQLLMDKIMVNAEYICLEFAAAEQSPYHGLYAMKVMAVLSKSLENTKKQRLKIRINNYSLKKLNVLEKITSILSKNCTEWMLIANNWNFCKQNAKLLDECLKTMKEEFHVKVKEKSNSFVVANKQCKINGYAERWIMQCQCCEQQTLFD